MEKLTKEDIQFIDNYLLYSAIKHKDIRIEMIDHIACAVESDMAENNTYFYESFKGFMLNNKESLVRKNPFLKAVTKRFFKKLLKELLTLRSLIIFGCLVMGLKFIVQTETLSTYFDSIYTVFAIALAVVALFLILYFWIKLKERYSIIGIVFMTSGGLYYLNGVLFQNVSLNSVFSILYLSFCLLVLITEAIVLLDHIKYYQKKYQLT